MHSLDAKAEGFASGTAPPATVAANGVLFLEPLNPALPDEPHDTAFPWVSVMGDGRVVEGRADVRDPFRLNHSL
jgi:hypothetical protein